MAKRKFRLYVSLVAVVVMAGAIMLYRQMGERSVESGTIEKSQTKESKTNRKGSGNRTVPVSVYVADYEKIDEGIRAVGTLLPFKEVEIASEIAGKVERIEFEEGVKVKRGSTIVKVNDEDLQSQLKRAVYQRDMLKEKLERNRILLEKDVVSREAFDQIETDFNMVEADIQLLNVKISKTDIRATFDGVIGFRYVSLGSYLQPTTKIARLVDCSKLRVEFSVPEKYVGLAKKETQIVFTTESDKVARRATVYAIDPKVDVNTRTVTMRAMYENRDMALLPGMFAAVTIGSKSGVAVHIPTEAIVPEANSKKVWVVENGVATAVPVTTGVRVEKMVEITSGIEKGDSVIVTGLLQVKEGGRVLVAN